MSPRVLVNGDSEGRISSLDRGLNYGDGLFETVLVVAGHAPLWHRHMARLAEGCRRLGLPSPDAQALWREVLTVARDLPRAVIRITLTRGAGERGYAMPTDPAVTRIVSAAPAPAWPRDWYDEGIRVRCCDTRLARQPALAGIKHLNRLEQVLARSEWRDADIAEGLMRDVAGHVICATAANLFMVCRGQWVTPALDFCGVAGVARAEVLGRCPQAEIRDIEMEELMRADEIFLTSSVRGIVPVRALPGRSLGVGAVTRGLQQDWRALGLMAPRGQA